MPAQVIIARLTIFKAAAGPGSKKRFLVYCSPEINFQLLLEFLKKKVIWFCAIFEYISRFMGNSISIQTLKAILNFPLKTMFSSNQKFVDLENWHACSSKGV